MTTKQLLAQLKKAITEEFGRKKCKEFNWFCVECNVWLAYEMLVNQLTDDWEHK